MIDNPVAARAAFDELLQLLRVDMEANFDDELVIRLAELDIALQSIEAVAAVTAEDEVRWSGVVLRSAEIGRGITQLVVDVLAWYSIAADPEGSNEEPIGGERARRLRSRYLKQLAVDEAHLMRLRDELAAFLPELVRATT